MELEEIKELVSGAETSTDVTREEASNMLVFSHISQWDDDISADVMTEFRGQFDLIKPKRNRVIAELLSNPVDVTFKATDGADPEAAETLTGMFRKDMQSSKEARGTSTKNQVDCGFGAFRFVTEYESKFDDINNYQQIKAEPISEANNVVYFDPNAKRQDKSDARWCCILSTFTKNGWETYCEENKIEHDEIPAPFKSPNNTVNSFWGSKKDEIKVGEFYYREKKRERVLLFQDPLGQVKAVYEREVKSILDELDELGYQKVNQKYKDRWIVKKKLVTGDSVLKTQTVPGEYIPVIAKYGDWSRVEGREIWRGIYHDAQDGQRLHNFNMSYMADIVAKGPRQKPVFYDWQIQGYERFWTQSGPGDNYPYHLINQTGPNGEQAPPGPLDYTRPPEVPQAAVALLEMTRRSVDDVTGSMMDSEQMMSGQVTEGQIAETRQMMNMETYLFQDSDAIAMEHAGRVYASMASELYDVPRETTITLPDGTEKQVMVMESVFDEESGEDIVINDITKGSFNVFVDTGPSFQTQKEQARAELKALYAGLAGTPDGDIVLKTYLTMLEGPKMEHLREYARNNLILAGIIAPDTDEEKAMLQQSQQAQGQQQDPMMVAAQAEMMKAQNQANSDQAKAMNDQAKTQVDAYNAETRRIEATARVRESGIKTAKVEKEITGTELDNIQKLQRAMMPAPARLQ